MPSLSQSVRPYLDEQAATQGRLKIQLAHFCSLTRWTYQNLLSKLFEIGGTRPHKANLLAAGHRRAVNEPVSWNVTPPPPTPSQDYKEDCTRSFVVL